MVRDYYVIGICILYIIGVGFCAYKCSNYSDKNMYCFNCWSNDKNNKYESINNSNV